MNSDFKQSLQDCLYLKRKESYEKVQISDILYVEACGSSLRVATLSGRSYVLSINLKHFKMQVHSDDLVRVHRSFVVNLRHIEAISGRVLSVNGKNIPYSPRFVPAIGSLLPVLRSM